VASGFGKQVPATSSSTSPSAMLYRPWETTAW
jgi:hypothetical protein